MIIFKSVEQIRHWLDAQRHAGLSTGFVPTMGALHEGHLSLLRESSKLNKITVASIFVNPTQFNDATDYKLYPVTIGPDIEKLEEAGIQALFLPSVKEIYPDGTALKQPYPLGALETVFEGAYRRGHFQGVCQVVDRLLDIIRPDNLFMGQKDYQQCMVISWLLRWRNYATRLHVIPTLREKSGLAMSSRNTRLSPAQREKATAIWQTMNRMKQELSSFPVSVITENATQALLDAGFHKVDYCTVADAQMLEEYVPGKPGVILCAAFMGEVRLIDNLLV